MTSEKEEWEEVCYVTEDKPWAEPGRAGELQDTLLYTEVVVRMSHILVKGDSEE